MIRSARSLSSPSIRAFATLAIFPIALAAQARLSTPSRAAFDAALAANGGRVIVTLTHSGGGARLLAPGAPPVTPFELQQVAERLDAAQTLNSPRELPLVGALGATVTGRQIDQLLSDPSVALIEPDVFSPLQEESELSGPLRDFLARAEEERARTAELAKAQDTPWGIDRVQAPAAWAVVGQGNGVKVGIMDSGGDTDHPDLVWAGGYNPMKGSTASADWDDTEASCNGHGTHVAGTVAARDNSIGVVGVAPGVSLYALKVFETTGGDCGAWASSQIAALNWAVSRGIRVVNASIGGGGNLAYMNAVTNAAAQGTFLVAAAGNTGGEMLYPAGYGDAIAVANLTSSNTRSGSSSYGPNMAVGAPGTGITSTMPGGGYGSKSGTSMASPHVTGVVALMLAQNPNLTLAQIRAKFETGSLDVGAAGWDQETGWGLIQAHNMIAGGGPPPDPLTLAVSPESRNASAQQGEAAPSANGTVTLTGDGAASKAWTASKKKSWTTLTTASGTGSGTVAWSRSTSGLAPGVYVDTITVTATGAVGSPDRIIDTLTITAAPVPLTLAVSPESRNASAQQGEAAPSANGTVTLSGDGAATKTWTASKKKSWTTLTTASGTGSGTVAWSRSTSGLAPGVYVDTITVTATGAVGSPDRIIDTLTITAVPVPLTLALSPTSRNASAQQGEAAPSANGTVTLSGDGAATKTWTASKKKSWTTLTTASGTGSGTVAWSRSTSGLAVGVYVDTITVTATGAVGSPDRIIDTLTITAAPVPLTLAVSPGSRNASVQQGTAAPSANGTVTLTGDGAASKAWTASKKKSWTTLTTASGTGSGTVAWSRSTSGLAVGVYVDTITVTATGAVGSPDRIIDTLTITAAPVPLTLAVSPGSRSTSAQVGAIAAGATGTVTLTGDGAASKAWTASKKKGWTTLTTASGTGSGTVAWSRSTSGLAPGVYVDTITVTATGAVGSPDRIIDTLTITEPLAIVASSATRGRTMVEGTASRSYDSVFVTVSGTGAATAEWRATKSRWRNILENSSGLGSGWVRWYTQTGSLVPGVHVDTIVVALVANPAAKVAVIDSLRVTAAPVPLAAELSPTSRRVTVQSGTLAPNDSVSVILSGDGAASAAWTASHTAGWNTLLTASGSGTGHLRWSRSATALAVGLHVDTITVTVPGAVGSPLRLLDSLTISAAPVPLTLAVAPASRRVVVGGGSTDQTPDSVEVRLSGDGAATAMWTVSKRRPSTALVTSSGTGSGILRWSRSAAGLSAGTYVDTLRVTVAGAIGSPGLVIDSLVVTAAPEPLQVALSPASRFSAVKQGENAPSATATLTLSGDGASAATWTAASTHSWVQFTTSSGIGSGTVRWNRSTFSLQPGVHVDTITVLANGLVARLLDSVVVSEVIVAPPTRQVTLARRGLKRKESRMQSLPTQGGSTVDSVQVTSVTGLGSTNWNASASSSWLTVTTGGGQAPGWLRWSRQSAALGVGVYVDSIVVVASDDPSVRVTYVDSLEIVVVPAPTPSLAVRDLFNGGGNLTPEQRTAFDGGGNRNGRFDLGDFLAWIRRNNIRLSASEMAEVQAAMVRDPGVATLRDVRARERER